MEKKKKQRQRKKDDDDDDDNDDGICEFMNGTKKVNSECLFIVFTFQELEVPFTWLCYVLTLCRTCAFPRKKREEKHRKKKVKESDLNFYLVYSRQN